MCESTYNYSYFTQGSSTATPNNNREEHGQTQQTAGQRNPPTSSGGENPSSQTSSRLSEGSSFAGEPVRVVPLRTVVAAVPGTFGRLPSDSSGNSIGLYYPLLGRFQNVASGHGNSGRGSQASGNSIGLYYPLLGRFQNVASGHGNSGRGSQASGEYHTAEVQTEQLPTPEPALQQQNFEQRTRDGNVTILQFNEVLRITWLMEKS